VNSNDPKRTGPEGVVPTLDGEDFLAMVTGDPVDRPPVVITNTLNRVLCGDRAVSKDQLTNGASGGLRIACSEFVLAHCKRVSVTCMAGSEDQSRCYERGRIRTV